MNKPLSKKEFQSVVIGFLKGARENNIFDVDDRIGELIASMIWEDFEITERNYFLKNNNNT